jgi:hypothetical protein
MKPAMLKSVMLVVALLLTVRISDATGEGLPFGHPAFYPSDDRPVGFKGDGNGYFPAATPVTEWWDGMPRRKTITIQDRGADAKREVWDIAETGAKNILWKTEMPSWAHGQPLPVGKRVFTYGEPNYLYLRVPSSSRYDRAECSPCRVLS